MGYLLILDWKLTHVNGKGTLVLMHINEMFSLSLCISGDLLLCTKLIHRWIYIGLTVLWYSLYPVFFFYISLLFFLRILSRTPPSTTAPCVGHTASHPLLRQVCHHFLLYPAFQRYSLIEKNLICCHHPSPLYLLYYFFMSSTLVPFSQSCSSPSSPHSVHMNFSRYLSSPSHQQRLVARLLESSYSFL